MTRISSIYNCIWHDMLLFCLVYIGVSCTDDYFSESGNADKMTSLKVHLPKVASGDSQITSARFIAFQAGVGGMSGVLQVNTHMSSSTNNVLIPEGNSNIYIIGNAPDTLNLDAIDNEAKLKEKISTWEQAKNIPHLMIGSYINVSINKDGVRDSDGKTVHVGNNLKRLISKLTVNLQYESLGGRELVIDSVTVGNRAAYSALLPQAFDGSTFIPSKTDLVKTFTPAETVGAVTTYQPFEFYLSEYIVDAAHANQSPCLYIHAHHDGKDERLSYPVYVGDWFGQGYTYEQFKASDTPAKLVGITGLSVTRNKHYTLTCKLKGEEKIDLNITTNITEWKVVNINGNISSPYLNISQTNLTVNPLKSEGSILYYESSVTKDNISVTFTDNPDSRFAYNILDNNTISFIHSNLNVNSLITDAGLPITGKAVVTATDGKTKISKTISLGVFNPISRFYVRGAIDTNYGILKPSASVDPGWSLDWASAMGYATPYQGAVTKLHGKDPNVTSMGGAVPDNYSGCSGYWESGLTDLQKGRGVWKMPSSKEGDNSEAGRLMILLKHLDASLMDFDTTANNSPIWSSSENGNDQAKTVVFGERDLQFGKQSKSTTHLVRCIRDMDSANGDGAASYLNVSHNKYEVAPLTYRTVSNTVPIYYESDSPVTISFLDENGNDISNMGSGMPFIGLTAESENTLYGSTVPFVAFPNATKRLSKGYFCLHSTIGHAQLSETMIDGVGDLAGPMPSAVRNRTYSLKFTAGALTKIVPIVIVNPIAVKDAGSFTILEAMGVGDTYSGYDYFQNKTLMGIKTKEESIIMLVPDTDTGCAKYYEGTPSDPITGVGNWFVTPTLYYLGAAYVYAQEQGRWGGVSFNSAYGDGANFTKTPSGDDVNYWVAMGNSTGATNKHYVTQVTKGGLLTLDKRSNASAYTRCERRLNVDILSLSTHSVSLSPGGTADVLYYTDAPSLAPITNSDVLLISGTKAVFGAAITSSNRITVKCNGEAEPGAEANLLIHTVGKSKRAETYKIIKLKVVK